MLEAESQGLLSLYGCQHLTCKMKWATMMISNTLVILSLHKAILCLVSTALKPSSTCKGFLILNEGTFNAS